MLKIQTILLDGLLHEVVLILGILLRSQTILLDGLVQEVVEVLGSIVKCQTILHDDLPGERDALAVVPDRREVHLAQ
eukprot:11227962-Heterocapsa_arctica.AAC.1